jgi:hypothetical protein
MPFDKLREREMFAEVDRLREREMFAEVDRLREREMFAEVVSRSHDPVTSSSRRIPARIEGVPRRGLLR